MMAIASLCLTAAVSIACGSTPARAETFKCKEAGGSVRCQDRPCDGPDKGLAIASPSTGAGAAKPATPSVQDQEREFARRRIDADNKAASEQVEADKRMQRCTVARRQLGVLKEQTPIFRRDEAGQRHYLDDRERRLETTAAQHAVAADCPR